MPKLLLFISWHQASLPPHRPATSILPTLPTQGEVHHPRRLTRREGGSDCRSPSSCSCCTARPSLPTLPLQHLHTRVCQQLCLACLGTSHRRSALTLASNLATLQSIGPPNRQPSLITGGRRRGLFDFCHLLWCTNTRASRIPLLAPFRQTAERERGENTRIASRQTLPSTTLLRNAKNIGYQITICAHSRLALEFENTPQVICPVRARTVQVTTETRHRRTDSRRGVVTTNTSHSQCLITQGPRAGLKRSHPTAAGHPSRSPAPGHRFRLGHPLMAAFHRAHFQTSAPTSAPPSQLQSTMTLRISTASGPAAVAAGLVGVLSL